MSILNLRRGRNSRPQVYAAVRIVGNEKVAKVTNLFFIGGFIAEESKTVVLKN